MEWDESETTLDNLEYSVLIPESSPFYGLFYDLQPLLERMFFPWANIHSKEPVKISFRFRTGGKHHPNERCIEVTVRRPVVVKTISGTETH